MARRASRRQVSVFGLSFLDAMTCGLGSVVLLFMLINASVGLRSDRMTEDLQAEVDRLDYEVLEGHERLVELRNSLRDIVKKKVIAQGLSRRLIEEIEALQVELATHENLSVAQQEHLNKLMADLKSLEESTRRLAASAARAPLRPLVVFVSSVRGPAKRRSSPSIWGISRTATCRPTTLSKRATSSSCPRPSWPRWAT